MERNKSNVPLSPRPQRRPRLGAGVGFGGVGGFGCVVLVEGDMSQVEVAERLKISRQRVGQLEDAALAKIHVLLAEAEMWAMDRDELRLLVAQVRNALSHRPRHPAYVEKRFLERVR